MNGKFFKKFFLLCGIVIICVTAVIAQTTSISGTVKDSNGAAIVGATIKILDTASNREVTVTTDASGKFVITDLRAGSYRVSASSQGFAVGAETIVVEQGASVSQNFSLSPGSIRDVVTVTAGKGSDRLAVEIPQSPTPEEIIGLDQKVEIRQVATPDCCFDDRPPPRIRGAVRDGPRQG